MTDVDADALNDLVRQANLLPYLLYRLPHDLSILGKISRYYLPMRFKDRDQCVMLSQMRLWDGKRLTHKMGQLPDDQFEAVKQALRRLLK